MANRHRANISAQERAEYEHLYGKLTVDELDPRFVLVTSEEEQRIRDLPYGVPVRQSQDPVSRNRIAEHVEAHGGGEFSAEKAQGVAASGTVSPDAGDKNKK
jgi:hypothetical protein